MDKSIDRCPTQTCIQCPLCTLFPHLAKNADVEVGRCCDDTPLPRRLVLARKQRCRRGFRDVQDLSALVCHEVEAIVDSSRAHAAQLIRSPIQRSEVHICPNSDVAGADMKVDGIEARKLLTCMCRPLIAFSHPRSAAFTRQEACKKAVQPSQQGAMGWLCGLATDPNVVLHPHQKGEAMNHLSRVSADDARVSGSGSNLAIVHTHVGILFGVRCVSLPANEAHSSD